MLEKKERSWKRLSPGGESPYYSPSGGRVKKGMWWAKKKHTDPIREGEQKEMKTGICSPQKEIGVTRRTGSRERSGVSARSQSELLPGWTAFKEKPINRRGA